MPKELIKLGTRAKVKRADSDATARLRELALDRAPDPSVFDEHDPFFWTVRGSSNLLDFYHTRMAMPTLQNFVRALRDGVSYQDSHNTSRNGMGQSLDGRLITTGEVDPEIDQQIAEVYGDFFTLGGLTLNGQQTDDVTAAIRAGVWKDVSVGFYATDITCGLCGKPSFEPWEEDGCTHIPGLAYDIPDGRGGTTRQIAFAWINDGELTEISSVYDGATPGAAVVKAERMNLTGRLDPGARARIERMYSCRIADPQRSFALGTGPSLNNGGNHMTEREKNQDGGEVEDQQLADDQREVEQDADLVEETVIEPDEDEDEQREVENEGEESPEDLDTEAAADDVLGEARARFAPHRIKLGTDPVKAVRVLGDEVLRLREKLAQERALADLGRTYRRDMIADALAAGVRANGANFKRSQYEAILSKLDIEDIRAMKADWLAEGDATFKGGRMTRDDAEDAAPDNVREIDPDRYRA